MLSLNKTNSGKRFSFFQNIYFFSSYSFFLFLIIFCFSSYCFSQSMQDIDNIRKQYQEALKNQELQKPKEIKDAEATAKSTSLPDKVIYTRKEVESLIANTQKLLDRLNSLEDSAKTMPYIGYDIFEVRDTIPFWQNLPTPNDYVLGPGDEIIISLYGSIEQTLAEIINRDGQVFLKDVGTLSLVGMNIDNAKRYIKNRYKDQIGIMCDVALDPYTIHGHDGVLKSNYVMNDETIEILIKQSLLQAQMGCDVLAPSDMMDGRIGRIRKALDKENFKNIQILSYAVKYASSFYGPFRDAVGSKVALKGDKKNYQMDFRNYDEAIREVVLDIKEGADMIMVKPGLPYLDIIKSIKDRFRIPVFAYQVSGEYSMLSNAVEKKIINKDAVFENLMSFKRAGANAIVSYYADRLNEILP